MAASCAQQAPASAAGAGAAGAASAAGRGAPGACCRLRLAPGAAAAPPAAARQQASPRAAHSSRAAMARCALLEAWKEQIRQRRLGGKQRAGGGGGQEEQGSLGAAAARAPPAGPMQRRCLPWPPYSPASFPPICWPSATLTGIGAAPAGRSTSKLAMSSPPAEPEDSAQEAAWRPDKAQGDWQHGKPPPEAQPLTADGQLHKLTLREGSGDVPPKHARCLGEGARRSIAAAARSPEGRAAAALPAAARDRWASVAPLAPAPQCTTWAGWPTAARCLWTPARRASRRSRRRWWQGGVSGAVLGWAVGLLHSPLRGRQRPCGSLPAGCCSSARALPLAATRKARWFDKCAQPGCHWQRVPQRKARLPPLHPTPASLHPPRPVPPRRAELAYRELGLNKAVAAMRRGEVARVWAGPQYGYGERGSFSFPTVPPAADLV